MQPAEAIVFIVGYILGFPDGTDHRWHTQIAVQSERMCLVGLCEEVSACEHTYAVALIGGKLLERILHGLGQMNVGHMRAVYVNHPIDRFIDLHSGDAAQMAVECVKRVFSVSWVLHHTH